MDEEIKNADNTTTNELEVTEIKSKKSLGSFIKEKAGNFLGGIKSTVVEAHDKHKREKDAKEVFERFATAFDINGTKVLGVKHMDTGKVEFRAADKDYIRAGSKLNFEQQTIEIKDVDKSNLYKFAANNLTYDLDCFVAIYEISTKQQPTQTVINNVSNTVTVGNNSTVGDIQQIAQVDTKLNEIEQAINSYKPSILNKKHKEEAQRLFAPFKSMVTKEQPKDQKLIDKFLHSLSVILPAIANIAVSLLT